MTNVREFLAIHGAMTLEDLELVEAQTDSELPAILAYFDEEEIYVQPKAEAGYLPAYLEEQCGTMHDEVVLVKEDECHA